jgi:hypothetical protein
MTLDLLIVSEADGSIFGTMRVPDPDAGPGKPWASPPPGMRLVNHPALFSRDGHGDTEVAYLRDDVIVWEASPLPACQARALQQIDAAGEALRLAVVNQMTMQTEEYRQALQQAQAWRAAGYPETEEQPAPPDVVSWAVAKWRNSWTAQQAADDILATATLWATVISTVRTLRLANKEDVRHADDTTSINAIVADMRADMRMLAQQLGLLDQYATSITLKEV